MTRRNVRAPLALGLAGCCLLALSGLSALPASAREPSGARHPSKQEAATLACYRVLGPEEQNLPQFVGLSLRKAKAKARASGFTTVRIVAQDGRCLRNTLDLRFSRVNLWVDRGRVIEARRF